ncbi:MAG TPA: hypothetical protein VK645_11805 [Chitinophagaceae bacterium]|jgi:hypothetical protein|nr:hypothetical protein [Chitinophagaceae bacterium]
MDPKAVLVTINAGKSLFGIIVINGQISFILGSVLINSVSHDRYNEKILEIAEGPSGSRED